jgi:hypothetical protein
MYHSPEALKRAGSLYRDDTKRKMRASGLAQLMENIICNFSGEQAFA